MIWEWHKFSIKKYNFSRYPQNEGKSCFLLKKKDEKEKLCDYAANRCMEPDFMQGSKARVDI